jgi:hypothetical protein
MGMPAPDQHQIARIRHSIQHNFILFLALYPAEVWRQSLQLIKSNAGVPAPLRNSYPKHTANENPATSGKNGIPDTLPCCAFSGHRVLLSLYAEAR